MPAIAALLLAALLGAAAWPAVASRAPVVEGSVDHVADGDSLSFTPARGGPPRGRVARGGGYRRWTRRT